MLQLALARIERLVGLCKLWSAIKYFHPYLAYRADIDWDAALIAAIPNASAATDASDYANAVQGMLAMLGDPATRVISRELADPELPANERQPTYTITTDGLLVVTINHYQDLTDFHGTYEKMGAIRNEIPKARGILFDLRAKAPLSQEKGYISFAFQNSSIATMLSSSPIVTAGERSRMHIGFVPQNGVPSSGYTAAFKVVDGYRILPDPQAQDLPIVFLINPWAELPPEAFALQIAGKAAIIAEGGAAINYFFPYKALIGEDWDNVLRDFIPRMEQADSASDYHLTVAEMITHIHDSHGFVDSPVLTDYFGPAWPPIRLQMIEDVPVITLILDEEATKTAGVSRGDIVLTIDGEEAMVRIAERAKYRAASTTQRLMYRAANSSLSGPEDSLAILTIRDRDHRVKEVKLPRKAAYSNFDISERGGDVITLISDAIGYADLDRLEIPMVDAMFEKLRMGDSCNALVLCQILKSSPRLKAFKMATMRCSTEL